MRHARVRVGMIPEMVARADRQFARMRRVKAAKLLAWRDLDEHVVPSDRERLRRIAEGEVTDVEPRDVELLRLRGRQKAMEDWERNGLTLPKLDRRLAQIIADESLPPMVTVKSLEVGYKRLGGFIDVQVSVNAELAQVQELVASRLAERLGGQPRGLLVGDASRLTPIPIAAPEPSYDSSSPLLENPLPSSSGSEGVDTESQRHRDTEAQNSCNT